MHIIRVIDESIVLRQPTGPEVFFIRSNNMKKKDFKTYEQQIDILKDRGISIINKKHSKKIIKTLELENFFSVINGYKKHFLASNTTKESFLENTTFEEIYSLFVFDRNIRIIYLKYLLKVEHYIKSVLAYEFSKQYGKNTYLIKENFDLSNPEKIKDAEKLIKIIKQQTKSQLNKNDEVKYYNKNYGFIPLWVLTNILTLGEVSHFYFCLKPQDMNSISRHFSLNPYDLVTYLKNLTLARNLCAHDERFYNYKYRAFMPTKNIKNFSLLDIPSNKKGLYYYGTRDSFSIAIILTLLLPKNDINDFVSLIDKEFNKLSKKLKVIQLDIIKKEMGFGPLWKNIIKLNTKQNQ